MFIILTIIFFVVDLISKLVVSNLMEVHDSIVEEVKNGIKNIMENVLDNNQINLKVSYAIGNNWLEAK